MEKKRKTIQKYFPLFLVLVLMLAFFIGDGPSYINLDTIKTHKDTLKDITARHLPVAAGLFMLSYILAVTLSLPVATLLTLLGGFLFGIWLGTLLVMISATTGASFIFLIARSSVGHDLRKKAGPLYHKIYENMQENAASYLLFVRLVPLFPFFLINIAAALFHVPLRIFVLTTFFGIIPGSLVYVNLGQALGDIDTLDDLITPQTLIALSLMGILAITPALYRHYRKNRQKRPAP